MKKHLIFTLLTCATVAIADAAPRLQQVTSVEKIRQDSLTEYTGKYELSRDTNLYVTIVIENNSLVATQSWDNAHKQLEHLNGDNFIVSGIGWSVQFVRGDDKRVARFIISAKDVWNKVSN
ncbi:MAG TPA: hypothetical protein VHC47_13790 [Mucilaginibacter sp.]|nr:hypothetical protein [Mucilaginibacter sp.]